MKKFAIITGCAKGIGREIALELARDGYNIIGTYNTSKKEMLILKNRIELIGVSFSCYKIDLKKENEIISFCNDIKDKYSSIEIFINNAAISLDDDFSKKTKEQFLSVLEVNLVAPFLLIQKLNKLLINSVIINICSTDGINTYSKYNIDYSASKAALINMTKSLSLEFKSARLYALCPNWVNTESVKEMNPEYLAEELSRIGQTKLIEPSDVARKVISIIESDIKSGSVIVMEDYDDKGNNIKIN